MKVIETSSVEWQSTVLTVVLHLHLEARPRVELESRDYKSLILATKLAGHIKEFGEQFQSHASSMELHNLEYAQRTEVLVRRSWSSECSIGEAGIVFT